MSFIFLPLSSSSFQLRHHRIITYGKHKYSFVPHSHAIFAIFCAFGLSVLLSPPHAFLSEFFIQAPLSIVSFCVRDVFNFQLTDGEELLEILYSYDSVLCLDTYCFLSSFDSYFPFGFQFLAWDHLYIIYCLPCFLFVGLLFTPKDIFKCEMDGASEQYSRPINLELFYKD